MARTTEQIELTAGDRQILESLLRSSKTAQSLALRALASSLCVGAGETLLSPPDNAIVLSVDEKPQIQALDRTQPMLQLKPGQIERRTHDYKRNGTTSLYAAFDIPTGEVMGRVTKRHRAKEFLDFLRQIEQSTPKELDLHIILGNSSPHKTAEMQKWLAG